MCNLRVGVDPLDHLRLFANHGRELSKDGAQLIDSRLDGFDRLPSLLNVCILALLQQLELHLLVSHWVQGYQILLPWGWRPAARCAV